MRILMLHNRYQQLGGEDISTRNEAALLRDGGHEVELVEYDNEEVDRIGSLRAAARAIWSAPAVADVSARLRGKDFDVLHGHTPVEIAGQTGWRIQIDTGAVFTGRLSAAKLTPGAPASFLTVSH